jgi:hypothetical protein
MIFWKPRRCHRCQQTLHRLNGSITELREDGGAYDVWHYHRECWYVLLKERGGPMARAVCARDGHAASGIPA